MTDLTVVKLGGSLLDDLERRSNALRAISHRWSSGGNTVVVHGGGKNIDAAMSRLGIPKRTVHGLRVTDAETLEVVVGVLAGTVSKRIVGELAALNVVAAGVSGADGSTLSAVPYSAIDGIELGFVGKVSGSDPLLLRSILGAGILPVVSSVAIGPEGTLLNVNADAAAAAIAVSLKASRLVFFTDVEGLIDGEGKVVTSLAIVQAQELLDSEVVSGGMKPKLNACIEAILRGVPEVVIAGPGRHEASLNEGTGGTHLVAA